MVRNSLLAKFHSVELATFLVVAHKIPKDITNPTFMQAEGKIPIFVHRRRVKGLASRDGFVNEMSNMLSEKSSRNQ
jgi:hypothetical protein